MRNQCHVFRQRHRLKSENGQFLEINNIFKYHNNVRVLKGKKAKEKLTIVRYKLTTEFFGFYQFCKTFTLQNI